MHRWATLAMLAQAFLVVAALTCNETQQLFAALLARPAADPVHRLRWSLWRRRHQTRARTFHYRRQANGP